MCIDLFYLSVVILIILPYFRYVFDFGLYVERKAQVVPQSPLFRTNDQMSLGMSQ